MTDNEVRKLWRNLEAALPRSKAVQKIIKLCLVTGQRVGEVSGMHADELDTERRLWTIPGARTKNKHKHVVPLSDLAVSIIGSIDDVTFLFPNDESDGPLAGHAVAQDHHQSTGAVRAAALERT